MKCDEQTFVGFGLVGWRQRIEKTEKTIQQLNQDISNRQQQSRQSQLELSQTLEQQRTLQGLYHEQTHFWREIDDLQAKEEVTNVILVPNGIRVTTKPLTSFKGKRPFEIDLIIGANKPSFRIAGSKESPFQLRCLNGQGHDSFVGTLLSQARLVEAAILALELIQFGDEGGPH